MNFKEVLQEVLEKGHSSRKSDEYFCRDKGVEWEAKKQSEDKIIVKVCNWANSCPSEVDLKFYAFSKEEAENYEPYTFYQYEVSHERYAELMA